MIETERLILRGWRDGDVDPFHAMSNDPEVMHYLGPPTSRADAQLAADYQNALIASHGYCFWAIERKADSAFLGFCGIMPGPKETPIAGEMEIGWRLRRDAWGQGYAREAAEATLTWAWATTDAPGIAAVTVLANTNSWGLMERLGMTRDHGADFDDPAVPDDSPLKRQIVYRIVRPVTRPATP